MRTISRMGWALAFSLAALPAFAAGSAQHSSAPSSLTAAAFRRAILKLFPATPGQIRQFQKHVNRTQKAVQGPAPKLVNRTIHVNASVGSSIATIPVTPGYVATISFVDSTGAPWQIVAFSVGNPKAFQVKAPKTQTQNVLVVSALGNEVHSNLSVTLKGQSIPFALSLQANNHLTDAVVVARMSGAGPNAQQQAVVSGQMPGASSVLMDFMQYTPPTGAKKMRCNAPQTTVWRYRGELYVRTRLAAIWPAWTTSSNLGGVTVYRMPPVPSMIFSHHGATLNVKVRPPKSTGGHDGR